MEKKENAFETLVEPRGGSDDGVALQHSANQDYVACRYWVLSKHQVCFLRAPVCATTHDRLKSYLVLAFLRFRRELMKGILRLAHLDQVSLT